MASCSLTALVVSALAALTSTGYAQDPAPTRPACPGPSVPYEGADDVVREVRLLRDDVRAACLAARDDADAAQTDADRAHDDAGQAHADALELLDALDSDSPATAQTVALDDATLDAAADAALPWAQAGVIGLAVTAGLVLVLLLMPTIRKFWP